MTCGTFLRDIYMLSRMKNSVLGRTLGSIKPRTRSRKPVDDVRLLFQSMADRPVRGITQFEQRSEDDNEDLLDVLFTNMDKIQRKRNLKVRITRASVQPAASALLSSCLRDLQGTVKLGDKQCLFELVVAFLGTRFLGVTMPLDSIALDHMMSSFSSELHQAKGIGREDFRNVILGSFVSQNSSCNNFSDN